MLPGHANVTTGNIYFFYVAMMLELYVLSERKGCSQLTSLILKRVGFMIELFADRSLLTDPVSPQTALY